MGGMGGGNAVKVVLAALIANGIIAIAKFIAWTFTGSSAMFAESLHSVADTGNQVLMLLGIKRAKKAPDVRHPYGYGKETYFWSFVVAISIFTIGAAFAFYEGIHKLTEVLSHEGAHEIPSQWPAIIVLSIGIVVEGYSLWVAIKEFRVESGDLTWREAIAESRAAAIITVLFEDAAAVSGLAIALLGVSLTAITGNPFYDVVATLLIGCILTGVAYFLGYMTKRLLIGQSASPRVEARIREIVGGVQGVRRIVDLTTLHMGAQYVLLNIDISFAPHLTTAELEQTVDRIEKQVKTAFPEVKRIYIEAESLKSVAQEAPA